MEIDFNKYTCGTCGSTRNIAMKRGGRYGIYCKDCGKLIKWPDESLKAVIKAREAWLKAHKEI